MLNLDLFITLFSNTTDAEELKYFLPLVILSAVNVLFFLIIVLLRKKKKIKLNSTLLPILMLSIAQIELILLVSLIVLASVQLIYIIFLVVSKIINRSRALKQYDDELVLQEFNEKGELVLVDQDADVKLLEEIFDVEMEEALVEEDNAREYITLDNYTETDDVVLIEDKDNTLEEQLLSDNDEIVTTRLNKETGKMILVRYKKSFSARLNLTEDENKDYYTAVKNKLLSYKKVKSRVSWNYDAFNLGRIQAAKVNIRGKSLFIYLPLNPEDYIEDKYSFKDCSHLKKYEQIPFRLKVKSQRGLKHAFELIEVVMNNLETTEINNFEPTNYYQRNRGFDKLLQEGLIKEIIDENTFKDLEEINRDFLDSNKIRSIDLETIKDIKFSEDIYEEVLNSIKPKSNVTGKKGIINIDTISKEFENGDTISVESLKEKKLIANSIDSVKCLARGTLDKNLVFELQTYSKDAIKMILITGGKIQ